MRGSSVLWGDIDTGVYVEPSRSQKSARITVEQRDGREPAPFTVALGFEDGGVTFAYDGGAAGGVVGAVMESVIAMLQCESTGLRKEELQGRTGATDATMRRALKGLCEQERIAASSIPGERGAKRYRLPEAMT